MTPIKKKFLRLCGVNYKVLRIGAGPVEVYVEASWNGGPNAEGVLKVYHTWDLVHQERNRGRILERIAIEAAGLNEHVEIEWLDSDPLKS